MYFLSISSEIVKLGKNGVKEIDTINYTFVTNIINHVDKEKKGIIVLG